MFNAAWLLSFKKRFLYISIAFGDFI